MGIVRKGSKEANVSKTKKQYPKRKSIAVFEVGEDGQSAPMKGVKKAKKSGKLTTYMATLYKQSVINLSNQKNS